jgi:DNA-binding transcriptional ArsR family regulator
MPSPSGAWGYDAPATPDFFVQAPTSLVRCRTLTPVQKTIYEVLLSYANAEGGADLGQARLAAEVGVSERTLRSHLPVLVGAGLVSVRRRGQGRTNAYQVRRVRLRGPGAGGAEGPHLPVWSGTPRRARAARSAAELESEERDRIERESPPPGPSAGEGEGGGEAGRRRGQIAADAALIREATGMDAADAARVAEDAAAQGQGPGYIAELVEHVTQAPSVQNPAGCLRALVREGKRRPRRGEGGVPPRRARPALAPEHYRAGGKYGHLFSPAAPAAEGASGAGEGAAPAAMAAPGGGAPRGPSAFTIQADPRLAGRGPAAWPRGQPGGGP